MNRRTLDSSRVKAPPLIPSLSPTWRGWPSAIVSFCMRNRVVRRQGSDARQNIPSPLGGEGRVRGRPAESFRFALGLGLLAAAWLAVAGAGAQAETIEAGPFSVEVSPTLTIRCNGNILFNGDRCVAQGNKLGSNRPSLVGDIAEATVTREGNTVTAISRDGRNSLRREVMVTPEALHLTFEARVFGVTGGANMLYELLTPRDSLEGTDYAVTAGRFRRPRTTTEGRFGFAATEPHRYVVQNAQYVALKAPSLACTIDFNPEGPWLGISNYGENFSASIYHDGERYIFASFCAAARHGATFTGKVIVRSGDAPYEALHPNMAVAYTTDFPSPLSLNFSVSDENERFRMCGATGFGDDGFGWHSPQNIRIVTRGTGGLLRRDFAAPVDPEHEGVLEIKQRSGLYLLTLNVYDAKEVTGPFDLLGPDGPLLEDVRIPRGTYWDKTVPLRIRDGKAALRFIGHWKINALSLQLILHEEEDFLFEQPYWNMAAESGE